MNSKIGHSYTFVQFLKLTPFELNAGLASVVQQKVKKSKTKKMIMIILQMELNLESLSISIVPLMMFTIFRVYR